MRIMRLTLTTALADEVESVAFLMADEDFRANRSHVAICIITIGTSRIFAARNQLESSHT